MSWQALVSFRGVGEDQDFYTEFRKDMARLGWSKSNFPGGYRAVLPPSGSRKDMAADIHRAGHRYVNSVDGVVTVKLIAPSHRKDPGFVAFAPDSIVAIRIQPDQVDIHPFWLGMILSAHNDIKLRWLTPRLPNGMIPRVHESANLFRLCSDEPPVLVSWNYVLQVNVPFTSRGHLVELSWPVLRALERTAARAE